jgi:hypothetical protein
LSLIIGLSGQARVGKDTFADYLVKHYRFVKVGLADPMKRFCKDVFDFSDEQLYGDQRDAPDSRYPRPQQPVRVITVDSADDKIPRSGNVLYPDIGREPTDAEIEASPKRDQHLTPRYALQTLGTEWGRDCYDNVWIEYGIRVAKELLEGYSTYSVQEGLKPVEKDVGRIGGVVFSDLRFRNEFDTVKKAQGKMIRIYRPGYGGDVGISGHASEAEQKTIMDQEFDSIVVNHEGLNIYYATIDSMMGTLGYLKEP